MFDYLDETNNDDHYCTEVIGIKVKKYDAHDNTDIV